MKSLILVAATLLLAAGAQAQNYDSYQGNDFNRGGGYDQGGFNGGRGPGRPGPGRPGPGYPDRGREVVVPQFTCSSINGGEAYCDAGGPIVRVNSMQQISKASCIEGSTWRRERTGIKVSGGCRANFVVTILEQGRPGGPGPGPGPGYPPGRPDRTGVIDCQSRNYQQNRCQADGAIRSVENVRQTSSTRCVEGDNYRIDYRSGTVWVDRGCSVRVSVTYW